MQIADATVARVTELYHAGLCLQAYRVAETAAPLPLWRGTDARLIAGRVAFHVGSFRLGRALHWLAYRQDPQHAEARYYHGRLLLDRRGPLAAWEFIRSTGEDLPDAPPRVQADWLAMHASILAAYRDAPAADAYLRRAEAVTPERPWICIERAHYHEIFDQYDAAMEAAQKALSLRPMFRPAVQSLSHLLQLRGRDEEALALLTQAADRLESVPVLLQLAALQDELGQYAQARESCERVLAMAPARDKRFTKWLEGMRSNAAYKCGDLDAAVAHAKASEDEVFKEFLEDPGHAGDGRQRVLLPVGFVRQHHLTCAPATLSTLSRFWDKPAEHLDIAERICFDGTPAHSERNWALSQGWIAREFTITWDATVALIDRGIPFTLTTVEPTNGHLQACVGYDSRRRTLLVRDPYVRNVREWFARQTFERYRSTGPRGMAMVPADRADLLAGIELPDAELYDRFYDVQRALETHDRAAAAAAAGRMTDCDPDHRLTLDALRTLASYDGDVPQLLALNDRQLAKYPDDARLQMSRISLLRDLARQEQRLGELRELCKSTRSDPLLHLQYAQELVNDARHHREAERRLRWVLRRRPQHPPALHALAGVLWDDPPRRPQALQLYRLAASLDDKDEWLAMTYFSAARLLGRLPEAMAFLRWRFTEHGGRSSRPAITLFRALEELDQIAEAFQVLDDALKLRSDDADLMLYAGEARARYGQFDRAGELLERAKGKSHETAWLRSAALLAMYQGELAEALQRWQRVAELAPLAVDAHRHVAMLLSETDGRAAAREHLRTITERFPHHVELHRLRVEWLREEPALAEPVIRHLIANQPSDAWAVRELAHACLQSGRVPEAMQQAELSRQLDPQNPFNHVLLAMVHSKQGRLDAARAAYREALAISVDIESAMTGLWELCDGPAQRREAAAFVVEQLKRQITRGEGLLLFRRMASSTLPREQVTAVIDEAHASRPDLWHAWSAKARQLAETGRLDEAHAVADEAARKRFPLLPGAWIDLANMCRLRGDNAGRIAALQQALQINPRWSLSLRMLADAQADTGDMPAARATLTRGVALCPTEAAVQVDLARLLWLSDRPAAMERLRHALRLEDRDDRAWDLLIEWSEAMKQPELAQQAARELVERRGGDAQSWVVLANVLPREQLRERMEALDRAVSLDPRNWDIHDRKAEILTAAGRFDEALAACRPAGVETIPSMLRGREAWVHAQRHELRQAIALMEQTVADDPGYAWGWRWLGIWYRALGDNEKQKQAVESLASLIPHDAVVQCDLADARLASGDRSGAKAALRRAMELDPAYGRAGMTLFDLQLEDRQHAELGNILQSLELHVGGEWVAARSVQYQCVNEDLPGALTTFAGLCRSEVEGEWPLQTAMDTLLQHMTSQELAAVVHETLQTAPTCNPDLAALWIDRLQGQPRSQWRRTLSLAEARGGEVAARAMRSYLAALAQAQQTLAVRWIVWRQRDRLRERIEDWAAVGYALRTLKQDKACARWLADWRQREGVEPWMLLNLALALRNTGRDDEAEQVSDFALRLRSDSSSDYHAMWLAAGLAARGEAAAAREIVANVALASAGKFYQCLDRLIEAATSVTLASPADRPAAFKAARAEVRNALKFYPEYGQYRSVKSILRRLTRRIAHDRGGLGAYLWHLLHPLVGRPIDFRIS